MNFPLNRNQYELLKKVGKGATAEVYVAKCLANGELVAIKMIDLETCPIEIETLHHEVAFWRSSQSPNIVKYYGSFISGSILYILMEYMAAGSCYEIMRFSNTKGIQNEGAIAEILHETLLALAYLHDNQQIHRDVKSGNILVGANGEIKIGDFGIAANLLENGQRKRARFTVIGTPCNMAPEVLKEEEGYTEKADIWSLGITALELATGSAPYSSMFPLEVIVKIVNSPPPQLPEGSKWSSAFRDFVKTCLVQIPSKRPSAKQLLDHKFFKQIKEDHQNIKSLIELLPPLEERFVMIHSSSNQPDSAIEKKAEPQIEWVFDDVPKIHPTSPVKTVEPVAPTSPSQIEPQPVVSKSSKFTMREDSTEKVESMTIEQMENTINELKTRVVTLKTHNLEIRQQIDSMTADVRQLMKNH